MDEETSPVSLILALALQREGVKVSDAVGVFLSVFLSVFFFF